MKLWLRFFPLFFVAGWSSLADESLSPHRKKFLESTLRDTGIGYQTDRPTAPVHIPGLSGASTPEEIAFNREILDHPQKCLFQGESSVEGEDWTDTQRKKRVSTSEAKTEDNSKAFLKACEAIKKELGPRSCSVIEIAGHAEGFSIGLGEVFGFKVEKGKWVQYPQDTKLFAEIVQCIQDISWQKAPVVFASCGAGCVEDYFPIESLRGRKLYYPAKHEAQQVLTNILGRTMYSALGAENVQEWGKHCRDGWCKTDPKKESLALPEPKLFWNVHGKQIQNEE